jgi:hypothetical protein
VKVPTGFGAGTATVVLKAETNPGRMTTVALTLGTTAKKHARRR